ncbi:MAG: Glycosyl transferase family 2 [Candidatus Curtissbacteria bacterium GW2011_GWC1_44_33]|uniref:Glycosyl transferase family 2 n=1 Tax=Candidatus Curtissbacteria bacterium GW2011_GWC1_44_33 TaxID=1618413 RepID=A0A0G1J5U2_9BACT|nr:MAG: Glycosyl transferase family 2 [Candidatus Curtissbacteria bacterium GW2011_GWC1_44_33]
MIRYTDIEKKAGAKMKISVIIPTFNEEKTIEKTLDRVLEQKVVGETIIVDDGSRDKTANILKKNQSRDPRIKLVFHQKNRGKGAAVRTGLSKVSSDYVLIQDADLEYDPIEYNKLISKASPGRAVYGSRLLTKNPHAYARTYLGNVLLTGLGNLLFGIKLTDSYTGYKLLPTKIMRALNLSSNGFELEAEITAKLAKRKILIIEVPISFTPRKYEQGKKIKTEDALTGALTFLKVKFGSFN